MIDLNNILRNNIAVLGPKMVLIDYRIWSGVFYIAGLQQVLGQQSNYFQNRNWFNSGKWYMNKSFTTIQKIKFFLPKKKQIKIFGSVRLPALYPRFEAHFTHFSIKKKVFYAFFPLNMAIFFLAFSHWISRPYLYVITLWIFGLINYEKHPLIYDTRHDWYD